MADRYWVGGTGTWNNVSTANWSATSGGPTGASPPVAGDDVFFNSASNGTSYTVNMTSGTFAYRNITIDGPLIGIVTFSNGPSATHNISGSVAVAASGVASLGNNLWGATNLTATTSGQTISLNGNTFASLTFNGVGGAWTITTNGSSSSNTTLTAGTLNFDPVTWTVGNDFTSSNSNVRSLNLGSATINVNDDWTFTTTTNLTFSAGTSTINMIGTSTAVFSGGGLTYNTVNFAPVGTGANQDINGANTFANVSFLAPTGSSSYNSYQIANNLVITGTLTATGPTAIRRIFLCSNTITTTITLTAGAVALAHVDFQNITVAGTAAPATGTGLGDAGGNSGITFPAAKTVYWNLAGVQNWSATAWALSPTGLPDINNFPLAQDTAVFTDSGSAGTVTIQAFNIGAVDASGRTSAMGLNYNNSATFYGSHAWGSGITVSGTGTQTFSGRGTMTFTSAGKIPSFSITVNCVTGTFQLGDAFTSSSSFAVTSGTFTTNSNTITCTTFNSSSSSTRTLNLGTSTINLTSTGTVWNCATVTNLAFNGNNCTINLTNTTTTARTMIMGTGLSYGTINIGGATGTSTTTIDATVNNITTFSSTKTVAHTIRFTTSVTIANWTVTGTAGNVVTVNSSSVGTQTPIAYSGSRINLDYMSFTDVNFSYTLGAANPYRVYAGANSVNGGNNNGIAFINGIGRTAYRLTTGTSWTVPADWLPGNTNTIHLIGAGGGGGSSAASGNNRAAGGGGGGGGYTVITNFSATPGQDIAYSIGTSIGNQNGGNTTWNSGAFIAGGGQRGDATTVPTSAGGAGGTGTFAGGSGGSGSAGNVGSRGRGGGGGGGAGGPNGVGGSGGGGFSSLVQSEVAGGGGGGNGGGSNGTSATTSQGGNGGNNFGGTGSGAGSVSGTGTAGTVGGGGGGAANNALGGMGGSGIDIENTIGGGGGRGGGCIGSAAANTGLYGGGGGGAGVLSTGTTYTGNAGSPGVIFIVYSVPPSLPVILSGVTIEGGVTIV
jgi:hypothetical protein